MLSTYQRYSNLYQARNTSEQRLPHGQHPYRTKPLETTYDAIARGQIGFIGVGSPPKPLLYPSNPARDNL